MAKGGRLVLEAMGFVDDEVTPGELLEHPALGIADLVGCDAYIPCPGIVGVVVLFISRFWVARLWPVRSHAVVGCGLVGKVA